LSNDLLDVALKVVDHVDALLGYWDRHQRCRFANAAYQTWFGRSRSEVIGIDLKELLGPLYEMNRPHIEAVLRGESQVFERAIRLPDGSVRHSLAVYYPDVVDGEVVGFSVQVADVSRLKELERQLMTAKQEAEKLATHDFLTGLPNRVLLTTSVASAIERARRNGTLCGVALIDFNAFKDINDTHGHKAGDAFLKEVASRMQRAIRATDMVVRLGGDEFILVICDVATIEAMECAIRRVIDAVCQPWEYQGVAVEPRLSCGAAVYPTHGDSPEVLMQAADSMMYQAKAQGKSLVFLTN
jgi:diguanylate cyclase (GGDEF)-like protein/PAS domain S-box-containing protein